MPFVSGLVKNDTQARGIHEGGIEELLVTFLIRGEVARSGIQKLTEKYAFKFATQPFRTSVARAAIILRDTRMRLNMPEMPPATLLAALGSYDLLPAIVFMPTRRRCDQAAKKRLPASRSNNVVKRDATFLRAPLNYPEIRRLALGNYLRCVVASHHCRPILLEAGDET